MSDIFRLLKRMIGRTQRSAASNAPPSRNVEVRSVEALERVRELHEGSAFHAAVNGDLNAEEYLKLDNSKDAEDGRSP